jgi:hypothetical protein
MFIFDYVPNFSGPEKSDAMSDKCNSENTGAESDVCVQTKVEVEAPKVGVEAPKVEVEAPKESVDFKVIYNKNKYDVNFLLDGTVGQLKQHLQDIIGISFCLRVRVY